MKKLICLFLAIAVVFALAAGCQGGRTIGNTEPTTIVVDEDALNQAAAGLGDLDDAARKALEELMASGHTVPPPTQPPETMPPPLPAGVLVDPAEIRALLKKALDTLTSGSFMIKAKGSSPFSAGGNNATPLTIAVDNNAIAMEFEMDWATLFASEGESTAMARIKGAGTQAIFGKRIRILTQAEGVTLVFVDTKSYLPMPSSEEEGGEMGDLAEFDMSAALGEAFGGAGSQEDMDRMLDTIEPSKVTEGGKEYLCAKITREGITVRYFFLGGELKRVETTDTEGAVSVMEVQQLTDKVDPALFSTQGLRVMAVDQMTELPGVFTS